MIKSCYMKSTGTVAGVKYCSRTSATEQNLTCSNLQPFQLVNTLTLTCQHVYRTSSRLHSLNFIISAYLYREQFQQKGRGYSTLPENSTSQSKPLLTVIDKMKIKPLRMPTTFSLLKIHTHGNVLLSKHMPPIHKEFHHPCQASDDSACNWCWQSKYISLTNHVTSCISPLVKGVSFYKTASHSWLQSLKT